LAQAAAELAAWGLPGMTLAVRAADGQTAIAAVGLARLAPPEPVRPDHLFQIGSITKSLVAIAMLRLADQGRIDLDASVLSVMPDLPVADPRVTFSHILSHTAGFPENTPPFPYIPDQKLWSTSIPGERWSYSNSGFNLLSFVIERVSGQPYEKAMTDLVLRPMGMRTALPVISSANRARYPFGYVAFRPDLAWMGGDPLAEGPWLDLDGPAGAASLTSTDMVAYLNFLAGCIRGDGGKVLTPSSAHRFLKPVIDASEMGPHTRYALGMARTEIDNALALHHTGGTPTFSSAVTLDLATGAGVFVSVNVRAADYRPSTTSWYGVRLLRALAAGAQLPAAEALQPIPSVEAPENFAGNWHGPHGGTFTLKVKGRHLYIRSLEGEGILAPVGPGIFASNHPTFGKHVLEFWQGSGRADRVWLGAELWGRDEAPPQPSVPKELAALVGVYRTTNPWVGDVHIVAHGDRLVYEGAGSLTADPGGWWSFNPPGLPNERLWFDCVVNGRAQRLSISGEQVTRAVE
jgi:CubicO group peptidase (beta-lactamase class C family)